MFVVLAVVLVVSPEVVSGAVPSGQALVVFPGYSEMGDVGGHLCAVDHAVVAFVLAFAAVPAGCPRVRWVLEGRRLVLPQLLPSLMLSRMEVPMRSQYN